MVRQAGQREFHAAARAKTAEEKAATIAKESACGTSSAPTTEQAVAAQGDIEVLPDAELTVEQYAQQDTAPARKETGAREEEL